MRRSRAYEIVRAARRFLDLMSTVIADQKMGRLYTDLKELEAWLQNPADWEEEN